MSDIRAIRQNLKPWPDEDTPRRYYVNDWCRLIDADLKGYLSEHPRCPSIGLLKKVGKVWYDNDGNVHVEGIYNPHLTCFIAKTMSETQFTEYDYDPSIGAIGIDWKSLIQDIPYEIREGACAFRYKGEEYIVD